MRRLLLLPILLLTACGVSASAEPRPTILALTTPTAIPAYTPTPALPYPEPVGTVPPVPTATPNPFEGALPPPFPPIPVSPYPAPLGATSHVSASWLSVGRINIIWGGTAAQCLFKAYGGLNYTLTCSPGVFILPPPAPYDQAYTPREGDIYFVSDDLTDPPDAQFVLGEGPKSVFFRFFPIMVK